MNASIYSELARMGLQGSGQFIPASNIGLIETRLSSLLLKEGYDSISALLESLPLRSTSGLRHEVVSEMCSGETWFFREIETLNHIVNYLIPAALARTNNGRVRVWCAGVSTGQEVLSLAMLMRDCRAIDGADVEIIATDISGARLRVAKEGVYNHFEAQRGLPIRYLLAYFTPHKDKSWSVNGVELAPTISYHQHNLLESAQTFGQFDVILCRNVFGTMAPDAQKKAARHLISQIKPQGSLVLGQSESLACIDNSVVPSLSNRAIYERAGVTMSPVAA